MGHRLSCATGYISERNDMKIHGMPEKFWVVTTPSPVSELADVCFPCTFERLLLQGRGGLHEDEIVGDPCRRGRGEEGGDAALGKISRPSPGRRVRGRGRPRHGAADGEEMTAKELGEAAVEAAQRRPPCRGAGSPIPA